MLTLQNRVSLNNLTNIRSLSAGTLTARAWETLRAAVQGVAPMLNAVQVPGGSAEGVNTGVPAMTLMRRGVERC